MKALLKRILPAPFRRFLRGVQLKLLVLKWKHIGRGRFEGETTKARPRREREGFFEKYCQGQGLDVGHGGDMLVEGIDGFDLENGDAQYLRGVPDESYDYVHSSHTLEHMWDPAETLRNWWRVLRPGGHLILFVPNRETYEKKRTLPSNWNSDHKQFFLLHDDDPPDTLGLVPLIERTLPGCEIVYAKECSEGHTVTDPSLVSDGEYSLEVVLRKPEHG